MDMENRTVDEQYKAKKYNMSYSEQIKEFAEQIMDNKKNLKYMIPGIIILIVICGYILLSSISIMITGHTSSFWNLFSLLMILTYLLVIISLIWILYECYRLRWMVKESKSPI
jgi:hypothetical protein